MPQANSAPGSALKKLTKGTAIPDGGRVRTLLVGTAGTANIKDGKGNTCNNVPLVKGYNPIEVTALLAGGTADDIWGVY